ncbi:MAG: hypothetical protein U0R17_06075 [Acidimicrobiia bacterium]
MVDDGSTPVAPVNAALLETGSLPRRLAGLRDVLLGNTDGVEAFNVAAPVVGAKAFPVDRFKGIVEPFLTRSRLEAVDRVLPGVSSRKLVFPRVNVPVNHERIVRLWDSAAKKAGGEQYRWDNRVRYLKGWDANVLSGYSPDFEGEFDLAVVSLDYDKARVGSYDVQRAGLEELQAEFPDVEIGVAGLGDGGVLAHRSKVRANRPGNSDECYVRQIDVEPRSFGGFVSVPYGRVDEFGKGDVDRSCVGRYDYGVAARVLVR